MKIFILTILLNTIISLSFAKEDQVVIAVALSVEPYIFYKSPNESNTREGFEIDIVRKALKNYDINFIHQPLRRTKLSFKNKTVNGVLDVQPHYPEIKGAYLSDMHMIYCNYAVTLKTNNFVINTIDDLSRKSIIAFQQASIAFDEKFHEMTKTNRKYKEMANQKSQISMLFAKRVDVIILDKIIFQHYRNKISFTDTSQHVTFHKIFKPSYFSAAFSNKKIRDDFNAGLKQLKDSGEYQKIIDSYINIRNKKYSK